MRKLVSYDGANPSKIDDSVDTKQGKKKVNEVLMDKLTSKNACISIWTYFGNFLL